MPRLVAAEPSRSSKRKKSSKKSKSKRSRREIAGGENITGGSSADVCAALGITDVPLDFTEEDYNTVTTAKVGC